MFKVDFKVRIVASLGLAVVVSLSPYAMSSGEAASCETSSATAVISRSLSTFAIVEEKVGKKTFTTSKTIVKATPARVWEILNHHV